MAAPRAPCSNPQPTSPPAGGPTKPHPYPAPPAPTPAWQQHSTNGINQVPVPDWDRLQACGGLQLYLCTHAVATASRITFWSIIIDRWTELRHTCPHQLSLSTQMFAQTRAQLHSLFVHSTSTTNTRHCDSPARWPPASPSSLRFLCATVDSLQPSVHCHQTSVSDLRSYELHLPASPCLCLPQIHATDRTWAVRGS